MTTFTAVGLGFWLGLAVGIGIVYLLTHPEFRAALFGRVHSSFDELAQKIATRLGRKP